MWWLLVFTSISFSAGTASTDICHFQGSLVSEQVAKVIDGDTIRLVGGDSVRVIGINAPEVERRSSSGTIKPGERGGNQASAALQALIDSTEGKVQLGFERDKVDHYGRLLAHVFTDPQSGSAMPINTARRLVAMGMVAVAMVPPNTQLTDCYLQTEMVPRQSRKGNWRRTRNWQLQGDEVAGFSGGYGIITGKVVSANNGLLLQNGYQVMLKSKRTNKRDATSHQLGQMSKMSKMSKFVGKTIQVRGWFSKRHLKKKKLKILDMRSIQIVR